MAITVRQEVTELNLTIEQSGVSLTLTPTIVKNSSAVDTSEWSIFTGTRAGGDLNVIIGDYDDSGSGTKIIVNADTEIINIESGTRLEVNSDILRLGNVSNQMSNISASNLTDNRNHNLPDKDITFAGINDITINSNTNSEPTGSDQVINVVSLTQAEYDAGTPVSTTLYIITDA